MEEVLNSSYDSDVEDHIFGPQCGFVSTGVLENSPKYYDEYDSDETVLSDLSPELHASSGLLDHRSHVESAPLELQTENYLKSTPDSKDLYQEPQAAHPLHLDEVSGSKKSFDFKDFAGSSRKPSLKKKHSRRAHPRKKRNHSGEFGCYIDLERCKNKEEQVKIDVSTSHESQMRELNIAESKLLSAKRLLGLQRCEKAEDVLKTEVCERIQKIRDFISSSSSSSNNTTPESETCSSSSPTNQLTEVRQNRLDDLIEKVKVVKTDLQKTSKEFSKETKRVGRRDHSSMTSYEKTSTVKIVVKSIIERTVTTTTTTTKKRKRRKERSRYKPLDFMTPPPKKTIKRSEESMFEERAVSPNLDFSDDDDDDDDDDLQAVSPCSSFDLSQPLFCSPSDDDDVNEAMMEHHDDDHDDDDDDDDHEDNSDELNPCSGDIFSDSFVSPPLPPSSHDDEFDFDSSPQFAELLRFLSDDSETSEAHDADIDFSLAADDLIDDVSSPLLHSAALRSLPGVDELMKRELVKKGVSKLNFTLKDQIHQALAVGNGAVMNPQHDLFDTVESWLNSITTSSFTRAEAYNVVTLGNRTLMEICCDMSSNESTPEEEIVSPSENESSLNEVPFEKLVSCDFRVANNKDGEKSYFDHELEMRLGELISDDSQ